MSQISIWNLALARLGDPATVGAPDERSRQAELCRQFYPLARRSVLEMRDWNFNTRVGLMAPLTLAPEMAHWRYAYSFPADALRVFRVGEPYSLTGSPDAEGADFEVITLQDGGRAVLTDWPEAACKFTIDVTDTAKWSPLFTEALTWYLASQLAGPLIQGETGRNEARRMLQEFRMVLGEAERSDANQKQSKREREGHTPAWMKGRGLGQPDAQPPYPRWITPEVPAPPAPGPAPQPFDFANFYNNLPGA